MANVTQSKPTAASAPAKVRCTVVQRYAGHGSGDKIEVEQREYDRLRAPIVDEETGEQTGRWTYPVLITDEHAREQARLAAEAAAAAELKRSKLATENPDAWAELQRQSREMLDQKALEAQERLRRKTIGAERRLAEAAQE